MHTRTMDADADGDVVTESRSSAPTSKRRKAVAFAKWEAMDGTTPQVLNVNTDMTNDPDGGDATNEALMVLTANSALIAAAEFTAGTAAVLTFDSDDDQTANMDEADEVTGTYNGAPGTYRCNGAADCSVNINAMGKVESVGTGWIFTPDTGATSDQPDYDYLHYGFWLQKTTDEDGVLTYDEVQTFAGSSVALSGDVANVDGSATYNGGATGVYVHSEVNSDGSRVATTAGQFAADATLMATFGQVDEEDCTGDNCGTIPGNMLNTVTGSISNFELENDEEQQWSVALKGTITENNGTAAGSANGGGTAGTFSATFHGALDADDSTVTPSSVVGEFGANFSNGSVAGAFGARK